MQESLTKILLVEDNPGDAKLLRLFLTEDPSFVHKLDHVARLEQAIQTLQNHSFSVVLLDLSLPDASGLDTFHRLYAKAGQTPIIVLSGLDDQNVSLNAVRAGAQDYLVKGDVTSNLLIRSIHYAIQRKRAEIALFDNQLRYRALFDYTNDAVFIVDVNQYTCLMANQQAAQMVDYSVGEMIGKSMDTFIAPCEQAQGHRNVESLLAGKRFPLFEGTFCRKDGSEVPTDMTISLVRDADGAPAHIQVTARNITERKQAEAALLAERALLAQRVEERTAELSAANQELNRAARMKDEFLATVSHELRTPLSAILNLSEALNEEIYGSVTERQHDALKRIEKSGRHLLSLINDILDVSKIESGKFRLDIGPVQVETVCQSSLQMVRELADKKHILILEEHDYSTSTIYADERRLMQILVNLLSNAIKFTPDGGRIGLRITEEEHPSQQNGYFNQYRNQHLNGNHSSENESFPRICFTIWDTGIGISEEDQAKLFKPFVQLDSALSRRYSGTGLGLTLVHRLTLLHQGQLLLQSEPGKGSTFHIQIPITPSKVDFNAG